MVAVVQRVLGASVEIEGQTHSQIQRGLLVLLGVQNTDEEQDAIYIAHKIAQIRIFADEHGKMNKPVQDIQGNILLVSQFTLIADTHKGHRPSFIEAARPEKAILLYEKTAALLSQKMGFQIPTGIFGADMRISLINDGPVTIILKSK